MMILLNCAKFCSKKWRFIKEQQASDLLDSKGFQTPLSGITVLADICF